MSSQPNDLSNPFDFLSKDFTLKLYGEQGETASVKEHDTHAAFALLPVSDGTEIVLSLGVKKCLDCGGYHALISVGDETITRITVHLDGSVKIGHAVNVADLIGLEL